MVGFAVDDGEFGFGPADPDKFAMDPETMGARTIFLVPIVQGPMGIKFGLDQCSDVLVAMDGQRLETAGGDKVGPDLKTSARNGVEGVEVFGTLEERLPGGGGDIPRSSVDGAITLRVDPGQGDEGRRDFSEGGKGFRVGGKSTKRSGDGGRRPDGSCCGGGGYFYVRWRVVTAEREGFTESPVSVLDALE